MWYHSWGQVSPAVQIHDALYALEVVRGLERPIDESADAACPI